MDNQTIQEVIKLIKEKSKTIKFYLKDVPPYNQDIHQYWNGMLDGLKDLKLELESIIK